MLLENIKLSGQYHHVDIAPTANVDLGSEITLKSFVSLEVGHGAMFKLGNRVFFNHHCSIRCVKHIEIGKDTMFGDGVRIFDHNHVYSNYHIEKISFNTDAVMIGKNCWIGANVVILKGVTIGDNVIIGAGSVIYKDIPANSIVMTKEELIIRERPQRKHHVFTLTASDTLEQLTYLVEHLPEVEFHIAAKTNVSDNLMNFKKYHNVVIYTNVHHDDIIEDLLQLSDIYLDINHWEEVDNIVSRAYQMGKSILSFDNVGHQLHKVTKTISHEEPQEMVDSILQMLSK